MIQGKQKIRQHVAAQGPTPIGKQGFTQRGASGASGVLVMSDLLCVCLYIGRTCFWPWGAELVEGEDRATGRGGCLG